MSYVENCLCQANSKHGRQGSATFWSPEKTEH